MYTPRVSNPSQGVLGHPLPREAAAWVRPTELPTEVEAPTPLPGLGGVRVCCVACGSHHSLAATWEGRLYVWGVRTGSQAQCGRASGPGVHPRLVAPLARTRVVAIAAGSDNCREGVAPNSALAACFAVDHEGRLFSWFWCGSERSSRGSVLRARAARAAGVLGHGHVAPESRGGQMLAGGVAVGGEAVGGEAVGGPSDGEQAVDCEVGAPMGYEATGSPPDPLAVDLTAPPDLFAPRRVAALVGARVVAVSAGESHALAVGSDGRLWSWGAEEGLGWSGRPPTTLRGRVEADSGVAALPAPVPPFDGAAAG